MIELRWLDREIEYSDTSGDEYVENRIVLQYRQRPDHIHGPVTKEWDEWSEWTDVPETKDRAKPRKPKVGVLYKTKIEKDKWSDSIIEVTEIPVNVVELTPEVIDACKAAGIEVD